MAAVTSWRPKVEHGPGSYSVEGQTRGQKVVCGLLELARPLWAQDAVDGVDGDVTWTRRQVRDDKGRYSPHQCMSREQEQDQMNDSHLHTIRVTRFCLSVKVKLSKVEYIA